MSFEPIRNQIKTKLQTIDSIQEVLDFPSEDFNGYPAALVRSTRNDSEFQTTIENKRVYVFTITILQDIESKGKQQARRIIEGVTDDIIEAFDKDSQLTGLSLPTNETIITTFPTLSFIDNDEKYTIAEIELNVVIQFNTEI